MKKIFPFIFAAIIIFGATHFAVAVTVTSCDATPNPALVNQTVTFTMTVSGSYTLARINLHDLGDPSQSLTVDGLSFTKSFATNDSWSVECQAANNSPPSNGSAWLTVQHAIPNHAPVITSHLAITPNPPVAGEPVTFTMHANDTDGDALSYIWDFGDGAGPPLSSGDQQTHTYSPGTYTATVNVADNIIPGPNSAIPYISDQLVITIPGPQNHPPVIDAELSSSASEISFGGSVTLSWKAHDPDGDPLIAMLYYFDGPKKINQTSTSASDTHTFTVPGDHTVLLTVSDQKGGLVISQPAHILVDKNKPPQINSVSVTPTAGNVGDTFTVTVNATDPEGGHVQTNFYWGDKTYSNNGSTTHVYTAAGNYNVIVEAYDDFNASSFSNALIRVGNPAANSNPQFTSDLVISPSTPKYNDTLSLDFGFQNPDTDGDPVMMLVTAGGDFPGNGTAPPALIYFLTRSIDATVAVVLDDGRGGTALKTTVVEKGLPTLPPVITAALHPLTTPMLGTPITFQMDVQAQDQLAQYYDFGGGANGSNSAVFHTGPVTVISVASDKVGHLVYNTLNVFSNGNPTNSIPFITAGPSAFPHPATVGAMVTFAASANDVDGDTLTFTWDFGDGKTGRGPSPTHVYSSVGNFNPTVTISDGRGGVATGNIALAITSGNSTGTNPLNSPETFDTVARPGHPLCPGDGSHTLIDRQGRAVIAFNGCLDVATNGSRVPSGSYLLKEQKVKVAVAH